MRFIRDFPCRGPPDGESPAGQVLYKSKLCFRTPSRNIL
nr:MAG TPA: hypothetical protein [Bacteriophage sp.]